MMDAISIHMTARGTVIQRRLGLAACLWRHTWGEAGITGKKPMNRRLLLWTKSR
jgi:hypothetical protein